MSAQQSELLLESIWQTHIKQNSCERLTLILILNIKQTFDSFERSKAELRDGHFLFGGGGEYEHFPQKNKKQLCMGSHRGKIEKIVSTVSRSYV